MRAFEEIYDYAIERKKDCPEEFHLEAALYYLPFKYSVTHLKGRFSEKMWDKGLKPLKEEMLLNEIKHRINEAKRILDLGKYPAVRRLLYNVEMFAYMLGNDKDFVGQIDLKPETLEISLQRVENAFGTFAAKSN